MRIHSLLVLACLFLSPPCVGLAQDMMTPLPDTNVSCNDEYTRAAGAYMPIVGDILRFDSMFESYAALCAKTGGKPVKDLKPFVESMRARADRDVDDSYHVMTRIIRGVLPAQVDAACKADKGAQEFALKHFLQSMDDLRKKSENRLKRSGNAIGKKQGDEVCTNMAALRGDFEKHASGKDLSNPLFEIAFLRGMVTPNDPEAARAYRTYRDILLGMQAERRNAPAPKGKK